MDPRTVYHTGWTGAEMRKDKFDIALRSLRGFAMVVHNGSQAVAFCGNFGILSALFQVVLDTSVSNERLIFPDRRLCVAGWHMAGPSTQQVS